MKINIGDEVTFGKYKWNVIVKKPNMALLLCARPMKLTYFNKKSVSTKWETSYVRKYLNTRFLKKFSETDQEKIVEISLSDTRNAVMDKKYEQKFRNTTDKFFLLSLDEIAQYFAGFENWRQLYDVAYEENEIYGFTNMLTRSRRGRVSVHYDRIAQVTNSAVKFSFFKKHYQEGLAPYNLLKLSKHGWEYDWWLRTNGYNSLFASQVRKDGFVDFYGTYIGYEACVLRPACWLVYS
ncbi:hypothetical protein FACS1894132_03130 [Clostridia bacterium]|nr:hypothetical protein FACS1894132_03130 [Clostridia bacterium]